MSPSATCSRKWLSSMSGGGMRSRNSLGTLTTHSDSPLPAGLRHRSALAQGCLSALQAPHTEPVEPFRSRLDGNVGSPPTYPHAIPVGLLR